MENEVQSTVMSNHGVTVFSQINDTDKQWESAISAIDYPVRITPLYVNVDGEYQKAMASTTQGKPSGVFGIVVDVKKTGEYKLINTVGSYYHPISTVAVYNELRKVLVDNNVNHHLTTLYVSSNGGVQFLSIALEDVAIAHGDSMYYVGLMVQTSVDATKRHEIKIILLNENNQPVYGVGDFAISGFTKHTKSSVDESIVSAQLVQQIGDAVVKIRSEITELIGIVLPKMIAIDHVQSVFKKANVPEKYTENVVSLLSGAESYTTLTLYNIISTFIEDTLASKQDRKRKIRESLYNVMGV